MMTDEEEPTQPKARKSLQQMRIDAMANEGQNAWACPTCGCRDFRVTNVWYSGGNKKRLRKCRNCDEPITTCELPVPDGFALQVKKIVD